MRLDEAIALLIVAAAALFLLRRMTGWPRTRRKKPDPAGNVTLGPRLAARVEAKARPKKGA
ncbi:MAG: hypothetical protein U1E65_08895 [Myxococcota bacterium]